MAESGRHREHEQQTPAARTPVTKRSSRQELLIASMPSLSPTPSITFIIEKKANTPATHGPQRCRPDAGDQSSAVQPPGLDIRVQYDRYRVLASKHQLLTRNKKDATTWYSALHKIRGSFIIDGEVCLLDDKGIPNFEEMSRVAPSASATRRSCGVASEPPVHPRFEYDRASVIAGTWMTVACD